MSVTFKWGGSGAKVSGVGQFSRDLHRRGGGEGERWVGGKERRRGKDGWVVRRGGGGKMGGW